MHFYVTLISVILTGCLNTQLSLQFEINVIIPVQNSVMTTTIPCVDALQNCDQYNYTRICDRDGIYATWAKQNCGAYCGYCTVMTPTIPCVDALSNCDVFNHTLICDRDGIYATWAKQNCRAYCGYCTVMTTTVPCVDALQNCDVYNYTRICDKDGIYATWAKQNCGAYCGHCTRSATDNVQTKEASGPVVTGLDAAPITTTPNIPTKQPTKDHTNHGIGHTTTTEIMAPTKVVETNASNVPDPSATNSFTVDTSKCEDNPEIQCILYNYSRVCDRNGIYAPWAKQNCRAYCGYCTVMTTTIPCVDVLPNCDEYQTDLCDNRLYRLFRNKNCRRFCRICTGDFDHLPLTPSPSPSS